MTYPQDVDKSTGLQFATSWRRYLPYIVGGTGIVLILAGILINYINSIQNISTDGFDENGTLVESEGLEDSQTDRFVKGVNSVKLIKVDISGAVIKPGLVETPADSRVQDVLISAGGFDAKADRMYISRNINLAQHVEDGMKLYIPFEGEVSNSEMTSENGISNSFNINSASQSKLEELPGIGPVTALKIIESRPYASVEELLTKKVLTKSVFEKIKDQVALY